jgi:hypothetical protein
VVVKWSKPALDQLDKALDFIIDEGFISYAAKLEESIISRIENLIYNYNIYPIDKYKRTTMAVIMHLRWRNIEFLIGSKILR